MIGRGILGAAIGIVFVLFIQTALVRAARRMATGRRVVVFMDPIVTTEDEKYSLSRFQMYLWTGLVLDAFVAVALARLEFPDIPQNLYLLMGINFAAAVTSTAIYTVKPAQPPATPATAMPAPGPQPNFVADIFFESGDKASIDLPRTQMFLWTIIIALGFVVLTINRFVVGNPILPDVPTGVLVLMGISQGAYLGSKAAQ
jgi:hypothetical protein